MVDAYTTNRILSLIADHSGKVKLQSESEIIAYFEHDVDMISAKIDLVALRFHVIQYMPRELVIKL